MYESVFGGVSEAIDEEGSELVNYDKSREEMKLAFSMDDSSFHEIVKRHASDHKQKMGRKAH